MRPLFRPTGQATPRVRRRRAVRAQAKAAETQRKPFAPAPGITARVLERGVRTWRIETTCDHGSSETRCDASNRRFATRAAIASHMIRYACQCGAGAF